MRMLGSAWRRTYLNSGLSLSIEQKTTVCTRSEIHQNSMHLQDFARSPLRHLLTDPCEDSVWSGTVSVWGATNSKLTVYLHGRFEAFLFQSCQALAQVRSLSRLSNPPFNRIVARLSELGYIFPATCEFLRSQRGALPQTEFEVIDS